MEAGQGKLVRLVIACIILAVPSSASPQGGTASGSITVNGSTAPLTYVYASAQPGFFDKSKEDIRVLASTVALSDEARRDVFELIHLARDGQATAIEIVIDADRQPISGAIFAKAFEGMVSATGMHLFEPEKFEQKWISGRLKMESPHSFQDVTFVYDLTFSAPIPRPPTADEVAAALASPPGQAASRHVAAILAGRLPAFVATLTAAAASDYNGGEGAARLASLKAETPPDSHVVGLAMTADGQAVATVQGLRDGIIIESTLMLELEQGVWKVGK